MAAMTELVSLSPATPEGVRTLRLNRPDKANALSAELVDGLLAAIDTLGRETRALVIRGEGRHFCAGFDFTNFEQQSQGDLVLRFVRINELLARLRALPMLTVAWVSGAAYGAGADIACACAIRLGTPAARFRFPGFQFGVALGTRRLAAIVGTERARSMLLNNEERDAQAALACGLLTEVVTQQDVDERLDELIARSRRLDAPSVGALLQLTDTDDADRDLAALVRSVSRAGLHERIAAYRTP
jgi:enoyl-CoA hydratase/carnithine racemase